jgi:hypothetical protein
MVEHLPDHTASDQSAGAPPHPGIFAFTSGLLGVNDTLDGLALRKPFKFVEVAIRVFLQVVVINSASIGIVILVIVALLNCRF